MADLDVNVAPDLHPDTFLNLDGVDSETAPLIAPAVEAFESAYSYIGGIHQFRKAAFSDPTLTPEGALLKTDDHAQAKLAGVTRKIDGAVAQLTKSIASLEADLSASVKEQAGRMVSGEVRALMQKSSDRVGLMEKALAEGDDEVLSAVLGAPPMLSGLTRELHAAFLLKFNQLRKPETSKRLKAMVAARTRLEQQGGLVLREMERAVGGIPVIQQDKAGVSRIVRTITPAEVRAKRDASAAVYAKHG